MKKILLYVIITITAFFMLSPMLWMVSTSFSKDSIIASANIIPRDFTIENYIKAWNFPKVFDKSVTFGTFFLNSVIVTACLVVGGLFVDSLAGYVLARKDFPGRNVFFYAALATLMIPIYVTAIPMFLIVRGLGWINTYEALIIPFLSSGFGIYMFKQYFQTIPIELEEAAKIDGYSDFWIYARVIVPLAKPAFGTMAILKFMWSWNMFFWPLIVTTDIKMKVLQLGLTMFRGLNVTQWGLLTAGMTIATLPPVIIYIIFQRYFTGGLMAGSLKG
ncbi:MAG TPA: carbohydrate ABC transporter permease [Clostridia bacterium]|nr:carbohydrate ABC transporter permease [Clostridia bacterium]